MQSSTTTTSIRTRWAAGAAAAALTLAMGSAASAHAQEPDPDPAAPATLINLADAEALLSAQLAEDEQMTLAHPLYQRDGATMSLRQFERGANVPDHAVPGTAMAFVMDGQLEITAGGEVHTVSSGQILVMEPNTTHSVHAVEPSQMLLTIAANP